MGPRIKQLMIYGTAGVGLLGGGWTVLAEMQGGGEQLQGSGMLMHGGPLQGTFPAGNSQADQASSQTATASSAAGSASTAGSAGGSASITPAPSAFALPSEGPPLVSGIHGGEGKIKPYNPNSVAVTSPSGSAAANGVMQITDPAGLGDFLAGQPGINAQLTNSSAVQVQDSTGASYSVTAGQLQSLLQLMATPGAGYSGTIDLSQLPPETAQFLLQSGSLSPVAQQQGSSEAQGADGGASPSQQGNQSGSPGGALPQQAQGDGAIQN